ncbi:MAG: molybdopterin molybdotransferase MoeA [Candidatus Methanomethylicaceae archaeon]|nr:molybdopterin molybdotransferase MoeA [Candidatus Verstraetearchaeota archaeon]
MEFKELKKLEEAQRILMEKFSEKNFDNEKVLLQNAIGRLLAEDVIAKIDVPAFDRAAVDGFALKAHETFSASPYNPAIFKLKGIIDAGSEIKEIYDGECYEISTGAPIPRGADAVVMIEDCEVEGEIVKVKKPVAKFANISLKGEDIKKGEVVLEKGKLLKPWHIGVLASIGEKEVLVKKRPKIGIFSTGNELINYYEEIKIGKTIDSTRPMIIELLKDLGCEVIDRGIIRDDYNEILNELKILSKNSDMIITIGGTSVGKRDLLPKIIEENFSILFHGLAIKPGKPTSAGIIEDKLIIMLPGYPVAALIGFESLVIPLLYKWTGKEIIEKKKIKAILSRRVPTTPGIRHFLRVKIRKVDDKFLADPIAITGSGLLSSIAKADGIVVIEENCEGLEEGEEVEVEIIR